MRVVVEITSGPTAGRKVVLGARQMLQVGRTEWADLALPHDQRMSSVHFQLETDDAACYVEDLGSSNGTFIGGIRLNGRSRLRNQDEVLAGDTRFVVRVEGELAAEVPLRPALSPQVATAPPAAILDSRPTLRSQVSVGYTVEKCDSGLTLCRGTIDEIGPADLAVRLCRLLPAYLIVDFKNLGAPLPEELTEPAYLFNWLDPVAAAVVSPVILAPDDLLTWPTLLEQGWGNDAVICLFSKEDKPVLQEHLRRACRTKVDSGDPNAAILGYCWPSVLTPLLSHHTASFVQQLLTGIEAVLVEMPDLPETWQVFGTGQIVDLLDRIGFRAARSSRAAPTHKGMRGKHATFGKMKR